MQHTTGFKTVEDNVLITTWGDTAWGGDETVFEVIKKLCFYPAIKDTAPGIIAARSVLSSPSVNRKVMPTQGCIEGQRLCKKLWNSTLIGGDDIC